MQINFSGDMLCQTIYTTSRKASVYVQSAGITRRPPNPGIQTDTKRVQAAAHYHETNISNCMAWQRLVLHSAVSYCWRQGAHPSAIAVVCLIRENDDQDTTTVRLRRYAIYGFWGRGSCDRPRCRIQTRRRLHARTSNSLLLDCAQAI